MEENHLIINKIEEFNDFVDKIKSNSGVDFNSINCIYLKFVPEIDNVEVDLLSLIFSKIKVGTSVKINLPKDEDYITDIKSNLRFSGFKNVKIKEDVLECIKNDQKTKDEKLNELKVITLSNSNYEKINENSLIDPNDKYQQLAKENSCITKPKPCKNCNCGRADELKNVDTSNLKSDCGKCYLGDAFRCEGCPFRGLPAFEPGQKLDLGDKNTITKIESENGNEIKIKNGKVKIDL